MMVEVRSTNVPMSEALEGHVWKKIELASRRFADRIQKVVVRLADLNGPRGGEDKRCSISARLWTSAPTIVVEATDADAYVAVSQATARLHEKVARVIARRKE